MVTIDLPERPFFRRKILKQWREFIQLSFSREASFAGSPDVLLPLEGNGVATADTHEVSYLSGCMGGNFDFSSCCCPLVTKN